jgi:hypothetical protein
LETNRFTTARRHNSQNIRPGEYSLNDGQLGKPELAVTKNALLKMYSFREAWVCHKDTPYFQQS